MKIEELSVGDWVQDILGNICIVRNIFCGDLVECYAVERDDELLITIDRLRPIPITAEILEKNGFKFCCISRNFEDRIWDSVAIRKYHTKDYYHLFIYGLRIGIKLCDVHQLQHALRLAGIEKEIEL